MILNRFTTTLLLTSFMTSSLPALDDSKTSRPPNVQAAFDAMEAQEAASSNSAEHVGPIGGKIPVMKAISMFRERIAKRTEDFRSMTVLGQLYIRLAKETGNHSAYRSAEKTLREALAIAPDYLTAKSSLAVALEAQHRFREAFKLASEVYVANPIDTKALATIGDCQIQLGQIAAAEATYAALLEKAGKTPSVLSRLAQLAELKGDPQAAVELLQSARDMAHEAGQSPHAVAWYDMRLAAVYHMVGDADEARVHYQSALELDSSLQPARVGLGRLLAEHGDIELALDLLEESVNASGSATAMIALADVLSHQGRPDTARVWYDRAEEVLLQEMQSAGTAHQRDLAMLYCKRGHKLDEAVAMAKQDLQSRTDIYAHDTLAWALHNRGRHTEAAAVIRKALQLGTKDPQLHYHAGLICDANDQPQQAITHLRQALQWNPHFGLLEAEKARAKLTELEATADAKL